MTAIGMRLAPSSSEQLVGEPERHEDQPVGVAAVGAADDVDLIGGVAAGGRDHQPEAGGADDVLDGVHHRHVHRVADVGDGEGDLLGAPELERAGDGVRDVVELGRGLLDAGA